MVYITFSTSTFEATPTPIFAVNSPPSFLLPWSSTVGIHFSLRVHPAPWPRYEQSGLLIPLPSLATCVGFGDLDGQTEEHHLWPPSGLLWPHLWSHAIPLDSFLPAILLSGSLALSCLLMLLVFVDFLVGWSAPCALRGNPWDAGVHLWLRVGRGCSEPRHCSTSPLEQHLFGEKHRTLRPTYANHPLWAGTYLWMANIHFWVQRQPLDPH